MGNQCEIVRAQVFVTGRVQGVGFRAFVYRQAELQSLTGWVRNVVDGRVELEVQGPKNVVDNFLRDVERGPTLSSVTGVEVSWVSLSQKDASFEIKY